MELGGYGFEKPELLKIAEEIYALKGKKQDLELSLHSEQFHYKYIPKRKNLVEHEVIFRLLWIIPITVFVIAAISYIILYITNIDEYGREGQVAGAMGVALLGTTLLAAFGGYVAFKLWKREIRMITLLMFSKNSDIASSLASKYDINTFQNDEELSKTRIEMLESEIASIDQQIMLLDERQQQLLEEKRKGEEFLRQKGVLFDEKPNALKTNGKFSLREDSMNSANIQELYEYYVKEEQYTLNYMRQVDSKLQQVNKQITRIDDDFENVKKTCFFIVCIYISLIIIQSVFTGFMGIVTSILCIFISICLVIYVEKKCKVPFILYLVENEHPMIQEYAFCHNMVPVRLRREEILEKLEYLQLELEGIRAKKQALDLS